MLQLLRCVCSFRIFLSSVFFFLIQTEFSFVDISSESVVSKMTDADQQKVVFVREFLGQEKRMENAFGD